MSRAPLFMTKELEKLPHVMKVEGGITQTVPVRNMENEEAELKLLSIASGGMNQVYLYGGRMPGAGEAELIVGKGFFKGNGLQMGEKLSLSVNGVTRQYTICGYGISPENMYLVKNLAEMLPSMAKYDAAFMDYDMIAGMFQMEGMANRFLFRMEPGYSFEEIRDEVENMLEPYGVSSTYISEDDLSVTMVSQELDQLKQMAVYFPVLFLGVASAFMLTATIISMRSLFDIFLFDELEKNQRQDISVSFSGYVEEKDALAILQSPRVERLEGVLLIGATILSETDSLFRCAACRLRQRHGGGGSCL